MWKTNNLMHWRCASFVWCHLSWKSWTTNMSSWSIKSDVRRRRLSDAFCIRIREYWKKKKKRLIVYVRKFMWWIAFDRNFQRWKKHLLKYSTWFVRTCKHAWSTSNAECYPWNDEKNKTCDVLKIHFEKAAVVCGMNNCCSSSHLETLQKECIFIIANAWHWTENLFKF